MQHVISVAFDFDDETVKKKLEQRMANEMYDDIKRDMLNECKNELGLNACYGSRAAWIRLLNQAIESFFERSRDEIIDAIVEKVARAQLKRKEYKEKLEEVCDASD